MPEIVGDESVGIKYAINGLLSLTPDGLPILGETPEVGGLWSAAAVWVKEGPGVARGVAEWMTHGEPEIDSAEVADVLGLSRPSVQTALGALGAAGRVGYDLAHSAYFHRELPYDRAVLETMHPRLLGARELYEQGAVRLAADGATVRSGDAEYVVRTDENGTLRCTCAWFARHLGQRGPCKHVLAVEHARRTVGVR